MTELDRSLSPVANVTGRADRCMEITVRKAATQDQSGKMAAHLGLRRASGSNARHPAAFASTAVTPANKPFITAGAKARLGWTYGHAHSMPKTALNAFTKILAATHRRTGVLA
jgi:hypothetical protein